MFKKKERKEQLTCPCTSPEVRAENCADCLKQINLISQIRWEIRYNNWLPQDETDLVVADLCKVEQTLRRALKHL